MVLFLFLFLSFPSPFPFLSVPVLSVPFLPCPFFCFLFLFFSFLSFLFLSCPFLSLSVSFFFPCWAVLPKSGHLLEPPATPFVPFPLPTSLSAAGWSYRYSLFVVLRLILLVHTRTHVDEYLMQFQTNERPTYVGVQGPTATGSTLGGGDRTVAMWVRWFTVGLSKAVET